MASDAYCLARGTVVATNDDDRDGSPHFRVCLQIGDEDYLAVSINMASTQAPPNLLVFKQLRTPLDNFSAPLRDVINSLSDVLTGVMSPPPLPLDYISRLQLRKTQFSPVPAMR